MHACCSARGALRLALTGSAVLQYEAKLFKLLDDYDKAFMFNADNVGSKQFMDIRAVRAHSLPPGLARQSNPALPA